MVFDTNVWIDLLVHKWMRKSAIPNNPLFLDISRISTAFCEWILRCINACGNPHYCKRRFRTQTSSSQTSSTRGCTHTRRILRLALILYEQATIWRRTCTTTLSNSEGALPDGGTKRGNLTDGVFICQMSPSGKWRMRSESTWNRTKSTHQSSPKCSRSLVKLLVNIHDIFSYKMTGNLFPSFSPPGRFHL